MCVCVCEELHSQLLAVETDMNNKNKELQTLHSSLTEAMVSKERLEQRVVELMEMSQHSLPDDSLQARVQVSRRTNTTPIFILRVHVIARVDFSGKPSNTLVLFTRNL